MMRRREEEQEEEEEAQEHAVCVRGWGGAGRCSRLWSQCLSKAWLRRALCLSPARAVVCLRCNLIGREPAQGVRW